MLRFDRGYWQGRRVLVTGHTGFKGAWLTALLSHFGAKVSGLALPPEGESPLCTLLDTPLQAERLIDIADAGEVSRFVAETKPEIIFHLAAQALVRRSYVAPIETFATNVLGTAHLLDAAHHAQSVRAVVVVTTDKVYENRNDGRSFAETDRLGGHDPYSTSKACAELVAASYRLSFFDPAGHCAVATARSGNVIGGGDWSEDRIVPDMVRSVRAGEKVRVRNPNAVRPWLHIIETLLGYLAMAEALDAGRAIQALNLAPDPNDARTVAELVERFLSEIGRAGAWQADDGVHPHEANLLTLSAAEAARSIGWRPLLSFDDTVRWTAEWYGAFLAERDVKSLTVDQIEAYLDRLSASAQPALAQTLSAS